MAILPAPPKEWKRPAIPLWVKLEVLLRLRTARGIRGIVMKKIEALKEQVAFHERELFPDICVEYDHRPPLSERKFDEDTDDTIPAANNSAYIEAISAEEHDRRTNGPGGEKRITSAGSDTGKRAKVKRLLKQREYPPPKPKQKLRSRGFRKDISRKLDGSVGPSQAALREMRRHR